MTMTQKKTRENIMTTFYIELGPEFADEV